MESFGDREHVSRNREKYAVLEERTKELGYKVGPRSAGGPAGGRRGRTGTAAFWRAPLASPRGGGGGVSARGHLAGTPVAATRPLPGDRAEPSPLGLFGAGGTCATNSYSQSGDPAWDVSVGPGGGQWLWHIRRARGRAVP